MWICIENVTTIHLEYDVCNKNTEVVTVIAICIGTVMMRLRGNSGDFGWYAKVVEIILRLEECRC